MLEMAESQHTNAQEILSFQAYSRRVSTNARSTKPSWYNLVSDQDDCVPEWHKSLIVPHFKDGRDFAPLCNHSFIVQKTFTGTENQTYYHTIAAFAYPLNNVCLPSSTTRLHGPRLLQHDPKWSVCAFTHYPGIAGTKPWYSLVSCSRSASLMFNQLSSQLIQPLTFHEVTQNAISELKTI